MGVAAFVLVWASSHPQFFAIVLFAFTVVNIVGWWLIVKRINPVIDTSRAKLKGDLFRLDQLQSIETHMVGGWQKVRFAGMIFLSLVGIVVFYLIWVREFFAKIVETGTGISFDANLLPPIIYLCYVLFAEIWIWTKRESLRANSIHNRQTKEALLPPIEALMTSTGSNLCKRNSKLRTHSRRLGDCNEMRVERPGPREMMAQMRPRLATLAPVARRRLRSLRERMS